MLMFAQKFGLDAHDNGSSNWLKFGIPSTQEHTNQKVPQCNRKNGQK